MIPAADLPSEATGKCDRIAYQYTAIVQPHAALLVLDPATGTIEQSSRSIAEFLGKTPADLNGRPLPAADLPFTEPEIRAAIEASPTGRPAVLGPRQLPSGRSVFARVRDLGGFITIEIEPETHPGDVSGTTLAADLNTIASKAEQAGSVDDLAATLTSSIRAALGYDRVMVYRFDPEWNGEIIGESKAECAEDSYLKMRFPTRDIPKSARSMFASARLRVTVDQQSKGSPIEPRFNPRTGEDIDLTHVRCRAAGGSCQTYYQNMGVRSTLVIPIFVDDDLWGLISCHHHEPRRPSPMLDEQIEFLGRIASHAIERLLLREHASAEQAAAELYERLTQIPATDSRWFERLRQQIAVLKGMVPCDGFALRLGGELHSAGKIPDAAETDALLDALLASSPHEPFATNAIPHEHPEFAESETVPAGALVVPLSINKGDAAVWFRDERTRTVNWAGDPAAGLKWDEAGRPELTPRNSFEIWKTTTAGTSRDWTSAELSIARSAAMRIGLLILSWETVQASRSKTEFLANMSHEIRTPLNAILGFAEILESNASTDEQREQVRTLTRNGKHLLDLVNGILDLAKIEAGRLTLERQPTDLNELLADVGGVAKGLARDKELAIQVQPPAAEPGTTDLDPLRIRQALINLIANAIRFTETGSITIACQRDTVNPESLRFSIKDTGIGMTPAQLERVFEPFEQADASTTRRYGGTGLGLAISRSIADLHGGSLTARSEPGVGTTFTLLIHAPATDKFAAPADNERVPASTAPTQPATTTSHGLEGVRILVVEDGIDNRRLIGYHLNKARAVVTFAEDGKQALDTVAERDAEFDLILMDMQMPVMDGYEATRRIAALYPDLPIVALTAHAMQGDRDLCLNAGCRDYLTKPIAREDLLHACARNMSNGSGAHTSTRAVRPDA